MTNDKKRRARGQHGVYFDAARNRYVAQATVGYDGRGKRIVKKGTGTSESAALRNLRARIKEYEDGLVVGWDRVTVAQAVESWLELGRSDVGERTREGNEDAYRLHIKPHLGGRRLKDLHPDEVDRWLLALSTSLSTSTLKQVRSVLKRSVDRAMRNGLIARNVVDLCPAPKGRAGRPSRSLTLSQAGDILAMTREHHMHAYVVVSLLTGVRPEEARALTWDRVHLDPAPGTPAHIDVWRSVRVGGDTKTPRSRRTLALSTHVVEVLREHRARQDEARRRAGERWQEHGLVFPSAVGTLQDRHNVLRMFRDALSQVPGLDAEQFSPRDLRHSFVSILSEHGLPIEEISRLMGHSGIAVTELVYRHELRPVLQAGASIMEAVFADVRATDPTARETASDRREVRDADSA
jgi:integrase